LIILNEPEKLTAWSD